MTYRASNDQTDQRDEFFFFLKHTLLLNLMPAATIKDKVAVSALMTRGSFSN